jgi:DNA end-binding protein Ku
VVMTRDELDELNPAKTRAIEIQDFVDIEDIDPIYFDSPYYLGPADGAEKAYGLLVKAMESAGKAAIARFVLRNKEHLAAIRPMDGVLTLTTMRFADEVVQPKELDDVLPESSPRVEKREREMAEKLIDSLSGDFEPDKYRDEYREQLLSLIEQKAEGKEIVAAESEEPEPTKAPDLMAALEESLAAVKGDDLGGNGGAKPKGGRKKATKSGSSRKSSSTSSRSKSRSKSKSRT